MASLEDFPSLRCRSPSHPVAKSPIPRTPGVESLGFFHQFPSGSIDFNWYSLLHLPYRCWLTVVPVLFLRFLLFGFYSCFPLVFIICSFLFHCFFLISLGFSIDCFPLASLVLVGFLLVLPSLPLVSTGYPFIFP